MSLWHRRARNHFVSSDRKSTDQFCYQSLSPNYWEVNFSPSVYFFHLLCWTYLLNPFPRAIQNKGSLCPCQPTLCWSLSCCVAHQASPETQLHLSPALFCALCFLRFCLLLFFQRSLCCIFMIHWSPMLDVLFQQLLPWHHWPHQIEQLFHIWHSAFLLLLSKNDPPFFTIILHWLMFSVWAVTHLRSFCYTTKSTKFKFKLFVLVLTEFQVVICWDSFSFLSSEYFLSFHLMLSFGKECQNLICEHANSFS